MSFFGRYFYEAKYKYWFIVIWFFQEEEKEESDDDMGFGLFD